MGYCIQMQSSKFHIAADKVDAARDAIVELMKHPEKGRGGSSSGEKWFSWMNDHSISPETSLADAMKEWCYPVFLDDAGNVDEIQFWGEKIGDENFLFDAIAPFVTPGSYIEMSGEDGSIWRWQFDGKTCKEVAATVTYEEPAEAFIPAPKKCVYCGGEVPLMDASCSGCGSRHFDRK